MGVAEIKLTVDIRTPYCALCPRLRGPEAECIKAFLMLKFVL